MTRTLLAVVSVMLLPVLANAEEMSAQLGVTKPFPEESPPPVLGNGGWIYADSPYVPSSLQPVVISRFTYSASSSPSRPFATNLGAPGAMGELGGELGLIAGLSIEASVVGGTSYLSNNGSTGGMAGLRFSVLPTSVSSWQLVLSAGWVHELTGSNGAWGKVQAGFETGIFRSQVSVHVEHVFAEDRDSVDIFVTAGVGFQVLSFMRLGVEYAGQDLEAAFNPDAEGGARHLLGPTLGFNLLNDKLSIVAGPALAMGATNLQVVGRLAVSFGF